MRSICANVGLSLVLAFPALPGTDPELPLPPHLYDIALNGTSCNIVVQVVQTFDKDGKLVMEETQYVAEAKVKYVDDKYPIWKRPFSYRKDDYLAYRDCINWLKKCRKARQER